MGRSGRVWQVCNFITPTHYKKKIFVTQPNPPSPKNRPNLAGWVGLGQVWQVDGFSAHPY